MAIVKRGDRYQVQVRVGKDPRTGKWVRKATTCDTLAQAKVAERALLAEAEEQRRRWVEPTGDTLAKFAEAWLQRNQPRWKVRTRQQNRYLLEHYVLPTLGRARLQDLDPRKVQSFLDGMGARRITEHVRSVLKGVLDEAERLGLVPLNAAARTKAPHRAKPRRGGFDLEQGLTIVAAAEGRRVAPLVKLAMYSGLRRGELCGLQWADVDFDAATLHVRRQVVAPKGGRRVEEAPKTAAGQRDVPLVRESLDALRTQKAMLAKERLAAGERRRDAPWVFPAYRTGEPVHPNYVTDVFRTVAREAGVPPLPFHSLRHTAAALLLSAGVEPAQAAKAMGHATLATFYSTYADLLPQGVQEVRERLQAFLDANTRAQAAAAGTPLMSAKVSANTADAPGKTRSRKGQ